MKRLTAAGLLLLAGCAGAPPIESPEHDFVSHATKSAPTQAPARVAIRRPDLTAVVAAARARFARDRETEGLFDEATLAALSVAPWLEHPAIESKRAAVRAALTEYDEARELEDLLIAYKALMAPGTPEKPVVSPDVETLRGRMADQGAEAAWFSLRAAIVSRAASILDAQAHLTLADAKVSVTRDHLELIDDIVPVVRARAGTGGSRQADLLAIRSERAAVAAELASLVALRGAAAHTLRVVSNAAEEPVIAVPPRTDELPAREALFRSARTNAPELLAMRARLERRQTALRLADLTAYATARRPGGGVRSAVRRELRDRIEVAERGVAAKELSLEKSVATARAGILGARARIESLRTRAVPDARRALEDMRASYAGRSAGFLDVFRAARRRLERELDLARAVHERDRAEASLLVAVGRREP